MLRICFRALAASDPGVCSRAHSRRSFTYFSSHKESADAGDAAETPGFRRSLG